MRLLSRMGFSESTPLRPFDLSNGKSRPAGARIKRAKTRVMPSSHLNDPEHWRDRAKEARVMAKDMADPVSKQKMLEVAANYEHLAKRSEDRRTGKTPQP